MAHFSLLDLSHAAFDDTPKLTALWQQLLILPVLQSAPAQVPLPCLIIVESRWATQSRFDHKKAYLMTLESTAQTQSPAHLLLHPGLRYSGLGAKRDRNRWRSPPDKDPLSPSCVKAPRQVLDKSRALASRAASQIVASSTVSRP